MRIQAQAITANPSTARAPAALAAPVVLTVLLAPTTLLLFRRR